MSEQSEIDLHWMQYALNLAQRAWDAGEVPVGAVLVDETGILGEGWNQSIQCHDPSAHAEMQAIRAAGKKVGNYRHPGATLYVTLEPCPMCAGLLVHARIARLVYAADDPKTGAAGSIMNLLQEPRLNHQVEVVPGIMATECSSVLSDFFKWRRAEKKLQKANRNKGKGD